VKLDDKGERVLKKIIGTCSLISFILTLDCVNKISSNQKIFGTEKDPI
jgi:hypothetical protein